VQRGAPAGPGRIEGLDVARALAIVAMVLINFQVFLLTYPDGQTDLVERWLMHLPSGRSSALFVTLAGAGVSLMARSDDRRAVRNTLLKRALFLLVVGSLHILVFWIDILHFYAFYIAFAALVFVRFSDRELLAGAVAIALFGALVGAATTGLWPDREPEWDFTAQGMFLDLTVTGVHPLFPWLSFICVGLWIGRRDLRDPGLRRRMMLGGALVAILTELLSSGLSALAVHLAWPAELTSLLGTAWSPDPLYVLAASGTSVLAIGACQEVVARWGGRLPVRMLVAAGQLSFTLYLLHSLAGTGIPRWAMYLQDQLEWPVVLGYWAGFCALSILFAWLWRRRLRRGPIEWIMRKLCGQTPPAGPRPEPRVTRPPPRWPWAFAALGAVAVLATKLFGVADPAIDCGTPRALTGRHTSELTLTCPQRAFVLSVESEREVTLETRSSLDSYLELYLDGERVAEDDDSGHELNARITQTLAPGVYRVVVRPYAQSLGPFSLSVD